jgi:ABC transport system ATP-binding/permease protein
MAYINIENVEFTFGGARLFDGISLTVEKGEKVALVGRNGSGKSTLLKLIQGSIKPDSGSVAIQKGLRIALLSQKVPQELPGNVLEIVSAGNALNSDIADRQRVNKVISQMELDPERVFSSLSAGLKRQVLLAKALAGEPDILLLDEPTNHIDIDSITRLEEMLLRFTSALIFVTHDRIFLQRIATRIVEIDRGRLFDQACDYETFLMRRSTVGENELRLNALFDKKLEKEEQWIRKGIPARRTRNEGRVRELEKLREVRRARRERPGTVKLEAHEAERSGMLVLEAKDISFNYDKFPVVSGLSTTILKGDRVGIIGPNGIGKTTLLRILLGDITPVSGSIRFGANLQIVYFDQLREQLDENKTVMENVVEGKDTVTINGKTRHIIGYLSDFLFEPEQARSQVLTLSGGERNRLLLARLFTRPSNVLVLDEPTNDLDTETLGLLEDLLIKYNGTVIIVSHDRAFINNVVTSTLVFEGDSLVKEYVGGYDDWLRQRPAEEKPINIVAVKKNIPLAPVSAKKPKFGFKQKKELESLPKIIEALETEEKELVQAMGDPDLYKKGKSEVLEKKARLESVKKELASVYARWEELEQLKIEIEN